MQFCASNQRKNRTSKKFGVFVDELCTSNGGRSGIRTLECLTTLPVFRTAIAFATEKLVCGLDFAFILAVQALP